MDLSVICQRLKERISGVREISESAGLDAAMRGNLAAPAVYLVPLSESGTELDHTGEVDQMVHQVFGVIQVVETLEPLGGSGVIELKDLRRQVKSALLGWVPDDETGEPVLFLGGELVQFNGDGRLWWSDEFRLKTYDRSTQ